MRLNNQSGVSKKDALRLALEDMLERGPYSLAPKKREPEPDRAMMTDEEQLASPERGLEEDEFLPYPGAYGQMDVMPMMGALTPAQRALKAGYKGAVKKQEELATGGFDKIKRMLGLEKLVRDPEEARAVVNTRLGNPLSHQLPVASEQIQPMMRQKALQDTREALKQRAARGGVGLPEGGYFFGIEPLDDTVVKGASLHKSFDLFDEGVVPKAGEILQNYNTKRKAQVAAKFGASHPYGRREVLEAVELDARKRAAADDILSRHGLAPESMVVRTPDNTYMVQDKAVKSLTDIKQKSWDSAKNQVDAIGREMQSGTINTEDGEKAIKGIWAEHFRLERDLDSQIETIREQIKGAGLNPSDLHKGNVMVNKSGKNVVVDTQDFYKRVPVQDKYGTDERKLEPLPKDHWRVIRKPR